LEPQPQIIILNGIGSVGKSSTAKALQAITSKPFLHVAMDAFLDMLPEKMLAHPNGLMFEAAQDGDKPIIAIRSGPVLERVMRGMRHAVFAMAEQGNNLIVDEVMIGVGATQECRAVLGPWRGGGRELCPSRRRRFVRRRSLDVMRHPALRPWLR